VAIPDCWPSLERLGEKLDGGRSNLLGGEKGDSCSTDTDYKTLPALGSRPALKIPRAKHICGVNENQLSSLRGGRTQKYGKA